MKKSIFFTILFCIAMPVINAQMKSDIEAITATVTHYYEGYIERDINKLIKAFDTEHGTMKVPIDENDLTKGFRNRYFKEVVPKWGNRKKLDQNTLDTCALKILNIDVESNKIASAKMLMKVGDITYIDMLSLHNIGGQWKITNKSYHVVDN